jgi:MFS family permease
MDLTPFRPWLVLAHVLGAFAFLAIHGVSMGVWWRLRTERDRARITSYLELSASMIGPMSLAGLLLIVTGILAGIAGGWWFNGQWWLWLSIGLLVVIVGAMTPLVAIPLNEVRRAAGLPSAADRKAGLVPDPVDDATLDRLLRNPKPRLGAAIGIIGIVLITWLMEFKPF